LVFKGGSRALLGILWRNIRNGWVNFSKFVSFKVGDGSCIRFFGMMYGAVKLALKPSFPKLYSIARDKESLVLDYLGSFGTSIHWNPSFIKGELES